MRHLEQAAILGECGLNFGMPVHFLCFALNLNYVKYFRNIFCHFVMTAVVSLRTDSCNNQHDFSQFSWRMVVSHRSVVSMPMVGRRND